MFLSIILRKELTFPVKNAIINKSFVYLENVMELPEFLKKTDAIA